MVVITYCI